MYAKNEKYVIILYLLSEVNYVIIRLALRFAQYLN